MFLVSKMNQITFLFYILLFIEYMTRFFKKVPFLFTYIYHIDNVCV